MLPHRSMEKNIRTKFSLIIPKVKQKSLWCGPASLKAVFGFHGVDTTQKELAKIAGTDEEGTEIEGLQKAADEYGFDLLTKDNASLNDIREALSKSTPPIVLWWSETDAHYGVVSRIGKNKIWFMDPYDGNISLDHKTWTRNWFAFDRKGDVIKRRMMILTLKM